jgi:hypothetical protein
LEGQAFIGDTPTELIGEYAGYAGRMRPLPSWIRGRVLVCSCGRTGAGQRTLPELGPARRRPAAGRREGHDAREPLLHGPFGEKANHRRNLLAEARDRGYLVEARDVERT